MALTRNKKDRAQQHLQGCLKDALSVGSYAKGVADDEVNEIQKLVNKIAEKIERAPEE